MHRPHSVLRPFSLRGLLVAGTLASLGLPLGRQARGIGGSAIQPTYTPRESVGAAPTVSLISTGASASAAASVTASGTSGAAETNEQGGSGGSVTRHVSSDDEGHGTTKKRRKRKAAEQEGGTRVARTKSSGGGTGTESKDYGESKQIKNALVAPPAKPLLTLSTGFESRYIYHGVDIVGFNSSGLTGGIPFPATAGGTVTFTNKEANFLNKDFGAPTANATSPILYINGNAEYKGFHLGVGYIHAIDETIPSRVAIENTATSFTRAFYGFGFPVPIGRYNNTKQYYQEVDLNLDYTLSIIANILDVTVGYNSFIIPDHDFKGTNYQGEAFGRITYKQIPYLQPSITYYRYISDARGERIGTFGLRNYETGPGTSFSFREIKIGEYLNGNYVEARLDGSYPLVNTPAFAAAFAAYGLISVNDGYLTKQVSNTTSTEFNTAEVGAKIPLTFYGQFSITPYINYGFDISSNHEANDFRGSIGPFKEDVWAGVTFSYRF